MGYFALWQVWSWFDPDLVSSESSFGFARCETSPELCFGLNKRTLVLFCSHFSADWTKLLMLLRYLKPREMLRSCGVALMGKRTVQLGRHTKTSTKKHHMIAE